MSDQFDALGKFLDTATEADFDRLKAGVLKRLDSVNEADAVALAAVLPDITMRPLKQRSVREECDWVGGEFRVIDEPGAHDPCWVVMPDGAMLKVNHHGDEGVDLNRAKFIVGSCNQVLKALDAIGAGTLKMDQA